ncbi:periphilin-1 isoform X2 [Kryptolebias marmoratus]|uniref:periphilin-1 isoform X2 n=1 Tax=Kryptolebias marmoratus TaxID=37003 RepID=UPI0007F8F7E8|nr:periphilin-1 isoform X2 [Kryptolebias marmoratus]
MAYHHERSSIREAYEELFAPMDPRDAREVTVHRVVNIVEKRNTPVPWQGSQYERGYDEDPHYGGPRNYSSARGYYKEDRFLPNDSRYFDENPNHENFRKNSPPHRNEGSYSQQYYGRDDLRHQLSSRNRSRGHYPRKRGRGLGPSPRENRDDYRTSKSLVITRDRSPSKREAQPPSRSRSNSSNRSFSPDRDKGYTYQQQQQQMHCTEKPSAVKKQTPNSSAEGSPHSSVSSKEKPSTSAAEPEEAAAAAASVEPELTPEEDIKARRWEAINAKVLEIEKHYSQDCETFRTVVKMLVAKEPSLETLLQAPLDQNLFEIRQRCLDALKSFVTELDEILEQPHTSE